MDPNYYGQLRVPVLNCSLEQLILILYPTLLVPAVFLWVNHLQKRRTEASNPPGCIKLGLSGPSHMTDQYEEGYSHGTKDDSQWQVKAVHIHPIKSCAPVELEEADLNGLGMIWDRKFAFAERLPIKAGSSDEKQGETHKWTIRTQRNPGFEKLALVKPEVWIPKQSHTNNSKLRRVEQTGALIIKYPNEPTGLLAPLDRMLMRRGWVPRELSFQVPLTPIDNHVYPHETVNIWSDNPVWLNLSIHVPADFRDWIGAKHQFTLFRVDPDPSTHRQVFRNAPRKDEIGYQSTVGFADAYPLHILNLASVHDVGSRIKDAIPAFNARRFRSNILVTGPPAYDEDDWKRILITSSDGSSHVYHCACHTVRCRLPNVDPESGVKHPAEPDKTLKSFRCIDEGDPKNACLGLQTVPADVTQKGGSVKVRVGDRIKVLERGEHLYIRSGH